MNYNIVKCICFDTTFEEMKTIMKENGISTLQELKDLKMVAGSCKLCMPYIKKMIKTGETKFNKIIEA